MNAIQTMWQRQGVWSATATRLKQSIERWRGAVLALSVSGATLEVLAPHSGDLGRVLAYVGAAALALVPVIVATKLGRDRIERWNRARSASEGMKKAAYKYLVKVPPFDTADRDRALTAEMQEIEDGAKDISVETALTAAASKPLPAVADRESYVIRRVTEQIDNYYRPRSRELAQRLKALRALEFVFALLAAAIGAWQAVAAVPALGAWVAVLTTAGTSVTAHIAAQRYEHMVIAYSATAARLESLRALWNSGAKSASDFAALVRDVEEAISIENQGWMAGWLSIQG